MDVKAIGSHVFMGGMTRGVAESLDVQAQYEIFTLGEETVEHNLKIPFYRAANGSEEDWYETVMDQHRDVPVVFGNPRCTGFSALGHGCSEDAHGAWSKPTVDIRQLCRLASWVKPQVWGFESVQQAATTGRDLLDWIHATYGAGYRRAELFHNAAQFGNAQHRRRVIFLWYKEGLQLPVEEVTEQWRYRGPHVTVQDALRGGRGHEGLMDLWHVKPLVHDNIDKWTTFQEIVGVSPWHEIKQPQPELTVTKPVLNHYYKTINDPYLECSVKLVKEGGSMNGLPSDLLEEHGYEDFAEKKLFGVSFSWHAPRKLHRDKACPVVYSASGKFMHPEHPRPLTVRELARLMGCDDEWAVLGPDPIAQLGKGLCVNVGRWIGHVIHACVTGSIKREQDMGVPHEIFRFDRNERYAGWVPAKPKAPKTEYDGYEED